MKNSVPVHIKCGASIPGQQLIQYVQPLSGTAPATTLSALKHSRRAVKNAIPFPRLPCHLPWHNGHRKPGKTENKCIPHIIIKILCLPDSGATTGSGLHAGLWQFHHHACCRETQYRLAAWQCVFFLENENPNPAFYSLRGRQNYRQPSPPTQRYSILSFTLLQDDSLYLLVMPNSDREEGFVKADMEKGIVWDTILFTGFTRAGAMRRRFNNWFICKYKK